VARVSIELPEVFGFETEIPVRIGDINYGGHLGNDAALALAHEARVQFLGQHGFTEADVGGCGIIMSDATIVYRSEAFYGQTVKVQIAAIKAGKTGSDLFYLLTDADDGREIARMKTGIVFFDYKRRRPTRTPDAFRDKIL
jgi:acyl-CoA thioester hydrolase